MDLIASTCHDVYVHRDYTRAQRAGLHAVRDGVRWHLIETAPYRYSFASLVPMVRAAATTGMQVVWDLFHYGWPDDLDIFRPEFVDRFASFARSTARVITQETDDTPFFSPINEISFIAWAAGEVGYLNPFYRHRGHELKCQMVRASIAAINAIRDVAPNARFTQVDPVIYVVPPQNASQALISKIEGYNHAVLESWEMLTGQSCPELGGAAEYLDIIGVNYYSNNQWEHEGHTLPRHDPRQKPLWQLLKWIHDHFQRPILISETGIEDCERPRWFRYICDEAVTALREGVPLQGICLYPILNHPGWDDNRHCRNGLWDYCNEFGQREIYKPLADELCVQQRRFRNLGLETPLLEEETAC